MGLTTIGDIDILYKQVQDLKEDLESKEELREVEYSDTIDHILPIVIILWTDFTLRMKNYISFKW